MKAAADVVVDARRLAADLEKDMHWRAGEIQGGWWEEDRPELETTIVARAAGGLEFLRRYAGGESFWTKRAVAALDNHGGNRSAVSGARAVGELIGLWADQLESGMTEVVGSTESAELVVTSDVMVQARRLLEDRNVHPAAPIILCGAALEISLRIAVEGFELVVERPSIGAYARALRAEKLITAQDVKDIEMCGGLRNMAAHGQFETLTVERAGLLEQQTNLLLRTLSDLTLPE